MNQISVIPLGTDASKLAGYSANNNDRLGRVDLVIENVGDNVASILVKQLDLTAIAYGGSGSTPPSGVTAATAGGAGGGVQAGTWTTIVALFTVAAKATKTIKLVVSNKTIGFFGSGNTIVNISPAMRNPANLRGAQFDIQQPGRAGYGFDVAFDTASFTG